MRMPTKQQRKVVILASVCKSWEIAIIMGLSRKTVEHYLDRAYKRLEVHSRKEALERMIELENDTG